LKALRSFAAMPALVAALALGSCSAAASERVDVTVDPAITYQVMKGWETTARLWEFNKQEDRYDPSWLAVSNQIFDRLVNELGINRVRLEIKSGAENPVDYWAKFESGSIGYKGYRPHFYEKVNDDRDPGHLNPAGIQFSALDYQVEKIVLPIKRRVEANGDRFFLNLNYVDFRDTALKGSLSHARNPAEYAELINAAFVHLKTKYGLVPDALEIILEPDNTSEWRGRQIGAAIRATSARLKAGGFAPEMIAPSTAAAGKAPSYIDEMMAVPGVPSLVSTLSYHRYDLPGSGASIGEAARSLGLSNGLVDRLSPVASISQRARAHDYSTAMLEHLTGDAAELYEDLTKGQVSAWQQYAIATKSDRGTPAKPGYYYILDASNAQAPVVRMADRSRGLAQYFRYVRIGAKRIEARSSDDGVKPVAFKNVNGSFVVVLASDSARTMTVRGLPPGRYRASYTTAKETGREMPPLDSGGNLSVTLPSAGILTIHQEISVLGSLTAPAKRNFA
jgi:O-glycosyl hydrolase